MKDVGEEKHVLFELILISCIESQLVAYTLTQIGERWSGMVMTFA